MIVQFNSFTILEETFKGMLKKLLLLFLYKLGLYLVTLDYITTQSSQLDQPIDQLSQ